MKSKLMKITGVSAAWLSLLVGLTASAFAQGNPNVSVNPTSLDFGNVEFDAGKTLQVAVKNNSQQQIKIGAGTVGNTNVTFNTSVPGSNQTLNPGEQKTVNISCSPKSTNTVNGTAFITAGFANQTLKKVADIAVKCTGVDPFFRFNLKPVNVSLSDSLKVQVTGDPTITQLNCVPPNDHDPFFGCDLRLRRGAQITVQSNSPKFQGFSNGTGAASVCSGSAPCSFTLSANSELTAKFAPPPAPKPTPAPTEFVVTLKKLGPGGGSVSIGPVGAVPINTNGVQNGKTVSGTFQRGIRMRLNVNPDANSTIRSVIVSGASGCNGDANCEFILAERVSVEVGFNKK